MIPGSHTRFEYFGVWINTHSSYTFVTPLKDTLAVELKQGSQLYAESFATSSQATNTTHDNANQPSIVKALEDIKLKHLFKATEVRTTYDVQILCRLSSIYKLIISTTSPAYTIERNPRGRRAAHRNDLLTSSIQSPFIQRTDIVLGIRHQSCSQNTQPHPSHICEADALGDTDRQKTLSRDASSIRMCGHRHKAEDQHSREQNRPARRSGHPPRTRPTTTRQLYKIWIQSNGSVVNSEIQRTLVSTKRSFCCSRAEKMRRMLGHPLTRSSQRIVLVW